MGPAFEESIKDTSLVDESHLRALMLLLAKNPLVGRASEPLEEIRTVEFAGNRVFYLPVDDVIYLLSVDSGGPEKAPTTQAKNALTRAMSFLASTGIRHLIDLVHHVR